MSDLPVIAGLVLAAGRSRRFGSEKAVALHRGRPMLTWSLDVLAAGCRTVAVNAAEGSGAAALARASGLTVLDDAPGDPAGPLAGIRAGLRWAGDAGADWLATVPCDTPDLPPDLVARLLAEAGESGAYALGAGGRQPLCALWSAALLAPLAAALAKGHPPVWALQDQFGLQPADFGAAAFANINRPADLQP